MDFNKELMETRRYGEVLTVINWEKGRCLSTTSLVWVLNCYM